MTVDAATFAARELAWCDDFEAGRLVDPAVPAGTGERVALRVPEAVVARLDLGRPPVVEEVLARGPLVVTDQRLLVLTPGLPTEFHWPADARAQADLHDGTGVLVFPDDVAYARGVRVWGVVAPSLLGDQPPERWMTLMGTAMWLRVSAGWYAFAGRLDEWREQVHQLYGVTG